MTSTKPAYEPLGFYRFTLAFLVFSAHTSQVFSVFRHGVLAQFEAAFIGVWMFFVVSGYIIHRSIEQFYQNRPTQFLLNRALRIYPTFIACFAFAVLLLYVGTDTCRLDSVITPAISRCTLTNLDIGLAALIFPYWYKASLFDPNPPSWTILIEVIFYLLVGLIHISAHSPRLKNLAFAGAALIAFVLFFWPPISFWYFSNFPGPFKYAPFIVLGGALALARRSRFARAMALVAFSLCVGHIYGIQHIGYAQTYGIRLTAGPTQHANAVAFAMMVAVLIFMTSDWFVRFFQKLGETAKTADRWVGDLTYPLYLTHVPVLAYLWSDPHKPRGIWPWIASLAICVIISVVVILAVDRPLERIRNRLRGRRI